MSACAELAATRTRMRWSGTDFRPLGALCALGALRALRALRARITLCSLVRLVSSDCRGRLPGAPPIQRRNSHRAPCFGVPTPIFPSALHAPSTPASRRRELRRGRESPRRWEAESPLPLMRVGVYTAGGNAVAPRSAIRHRCFPPHVSLLVRTAPTSAYVACNF